SHLVWVQENEKLTGPRWPFDNSRATAAVSLYEYSGHHNKQPLLVGVTGGRGSPDLLSVCGTSLGSRTSIGTNGAPWDALSANGRTVYFDAFGADSIGQTGCVGTGAN